MAASSIAAASSIGLSWKGKTTCSFARNSSGVKKSLRLNPSPDEGSNIAEGTMLADEVVEVLSATGEDNYWVLVQLALTGCQGYVKKEHLAACPEGTREHDRLTAVPGEVKKMSIPDTDRRFTEVQDFIGKSDTHKKQVVAKKVWLIIGHYLGETGMRTGKKESLLHGAKDATSDAIIAGGFDDHFASIGDFGNGVYFTPESCMSMNFAENYMMICEVALGLEENRIKPNVSDFATLDEYHKVCSELCYDNVNRKGKRSVHATGTKYGSTRGHQERIVYHPTQCKPVYLIELESPGLAGDKYHKGTDSYRPCYLKAA